MLIAVAFVACVVAVFSFCVYLGGRLNGVPAPPRHLKFAKPVEHSRLQRQLDRIAKAKAADRLDAEREAAV